MNNDIHELNFNELDAVSGGVRSRANDIGFHPTYQTSFWKQQRQPLIREWLLSRHDRQRRRPSVRNATSVRPVVL